MRTHAPEIESNLSKRTAQRAVSAALFTGVSMLVPGAAYAQSLNAATEEPPGEASVIDRTVGKLHDWNVTLGAAPMVLPKYEGSDEFEVVPLPLISATFAERVHLDVTGISADLYQANGFTLGLKGGYEIGRQESDSRDLRGLGDIDPGGVVGGYVSYQIEPFEAYARLNKTIGASDGLLGIVGTSVSHQYQKFSFSADLSATWADENYMESYFGVDARQSERSGLSEYKAEAGIKRADLKGSVTYMLTDNWLITGSAGAGLLLGDAADSPITKEKLQPFALVGLGYRF